MESTSHLCQVGLAVIAKMSQDALTIALTSLASVAEEMQGLFPG